MPHDTRNVLLASATALLDEGGVEAVTLREVGRMSGVSHMAPYKHFHDKESLLAVIATREVERLGHMIDHAADAPDDLGGTLHSVLHSYVSWALEHPVRFRLIYCGPWTRPRRELEEALGRTSERVTDVVRRCQRGGELAGHDPERCTCLLLAAAHGAVQLRLAGHPASAGDPDVVVDDLLGLLRSPR
ncbi:TetR/AcrR family transcriptional regulator [Nocardiopsis lambiniae]|uniref:TetR/AcrR family transcriptional regulator n=1 Tax=Nocardiopsis lambiniae TaxID=3075539 RepID=A0ABU2M4S0_9ACTN|nr:TetR/AcrR family transcriptional regulator [Nocardiopsis sp. DSM 44743]MDT0327634.1 TetR/AcrR family transcriptional regulator [Nocardiopsis sp. DSM 44743]